PMVFSTLVTLVMNPYLALIPLITASYCGPLVTSSAVPRSCTVPALGRPRLSPGWRVMPGFRRSRLTFPVRDEVQNPTAPPASATIQVAVEMRSPDGRYVVVHTYFSSLMAMRRTLVLPPRREGGSEQRVLPKPPSRGGGALGRAG